MAGIGAYVKVEGFAFLPVTSFSLAMSTYISQNLGAGKKDRMRKGIAFGLLCTVILIELIGVVIFIAAPSLISAFNSEPEVVYYGVMRARVTALFFFLMGFSNVTASIMRGVGKPIIPTVVMLVCWCAVRVLVFTTIGQVYHDIRLTCWIYPITWGLSTIVYIICLVRLRVKKTI
jgi:Na+-driven multidrug efflux pump